jgi:hypothetical protein
VSSLTEYLLTSPVQSFILWGGIALLVILLLLRQPAVLTLAADPKGRLQISRHALHRLVEACCEQVHGVASARAVINRHGDRLDTVIRLKIRPDAKLDAIQGYLNQEIADIYRQNLGLKGEIGPIEVKVVGVIPADKGF